MDIPTIIRRTEQGLSKKGLFINISIISHLWFIYLCYRLFEGFRHVELVILITIFTWTSRGIFIGRESRIDKYHKTWLFILYWAVYAGLALILAAELLELKTLLDYALVGCIILSLMTFGMYLICLLADEK